MFSHLQEALGIDVGNFVIRFCNYFGNRVALLDSFEIVADWLDFSTTAMLSVLEQRKGRFMC